MSKQTEKLWSVNIQIAYHNILFQCKEEEIETYLYDFIWENKKDFEYDYKQGDPNNRELITEYPIPTNNK